MTKSKTKNYRDAKRSMARSQQRGDKTLRRLKEDLAVASRDAMRLVKANDTLQAQVTAAKADAAEARAGRDESQVLLTRAFREHDAAAHERDDLRRQLESERNVASVRDRDAGIHQADLNRAEINLAAALDELLRTRDIATSRAAERDAIIVQRDELARRVHDLENVVDTAGV